MKSIVASLVKGTILASTVAALNGCANYTVAPVCNEANATVIPGMTGTYTVTTQKEDFSTETQTFEISPAKRPGAVRISTKDGDAESSVCAIGGKFIVEEQDKETQGYHQSQVFVSGMGITQLPMFYDKPELERFGISVKVIEIPHQVSQLLGKTLTTWVENLAAKAGALVSESGSHGIMVDNTSLDSKTLISLAKTGPVGLTLLRK